MASRASETRDSRGVGELTLGAQLDYLSCAHLKDGPSWARRLEMKRVMAVVVGLASLGVGVAWALPMDGGLQSRVYAGRVCSNHVLYDRYVEAGVGFVYVPLNASC